MTFEHREIGTTFDWYRGEVDISDRIRRTERAMIEQMNQCLYSGDTAPPKRISRTALITRFIERAIDAWAVLRGRAEVGY